MKMLCCPLISTPPFHLHSKNLNEELKHFSRPVAFFSFFFLWGISSIKIAGPQDQLPLQVLSFLLAASLFYSPEPSRRVLTGGLDFCKGGVPRMSLTSGTHRSDWRSKTHVRHFNTFALVHLRHPMCLLRENVAR